MKTIEEFKSEIESEKKHDLKVIGSLLLERFENDEELFKKYISKKFTLSTFFNEVHNRVREERAKASRSYCFVDKDDFVGFLVHCIDESKGAHVSNEDVPKETKVVKEKPSKAKPKKKDSKDEPKEFIVAAFDDEIVNNNSNDSCKEQMRLF